MTVETKVEIVGLKDSLRVLQTYNKSLRRQITKDFAYAVKDPVDHIRIEIPDKAPISGWERNWTTRSGFKMLPWDGKLADKSVKPFVSGKKPKEFQGRVQNLAVFGIRWANSRATLFDMSDKARTLRGHFMIRGLTGKFGPASRVMWPTFKHYEPQVIDNVAELVDKVTRAANEELKRAGK